MMDSLLKRIEKSKKAHGRWIAMVLCLSMLVSLGTFAGFRKTAVAKVYTREVLDCPYTHEGAEPVAHVHNDDCYDGDTLVCTLPELEAHTHSDACYTERQVLTCTLEENPGHQHTDACYVEHKVQSCGLEENPGHVHNGTCYNESGVLICQIPEGEGAHTHTDDCYTVERELTCAIPEGEGAHTHGAECFETVRELTCGKAELTPHVHGPECIRTEEITVDEPEETVEPKVTAESEVTAQPEVNTEPEVTAQPEASAAPEMPVSDPNADLESASDWERDFDGMELSGNWAEDLVLVAATQQGHGESQNNFEAVLNDAGDAWVRHGYTRYGAWSGAPYADEWSAMFVSFCLRYAGIPAENVPNNPTAALMAESFQKGELFAGPDYLPAVGDLIFFDTDDEEGIDHMGIVYHVDEENGSLNTVEGSRTDAVETFGYRMDDEEIAGYGILPQNPDYTPVEENTEDMTDDLIVMTTDEEEEKKENEEGKPVEEIKTAEEVTAPAVPMPAQSWERTAGGIKVTVEAPEGAFPENTKIAVTPVNGNSLKDTVSDAVSGEVLEVQAVDITFFDADGNEIEPAVPIRVVMTPAETEHAEEKTNVVHIDLDQQTAEVIEQAAGTETDNSEVVFDADAFTIYAIVYTVDTYFRSCTGETFRVTMDFDENAGIPQNAELVIEEILEESANYSDLLSQAENALEGNKQISFVRFFDISIMADGEEVQPLAPVSVKIQLADLPEVTAAADAQVIHFGKQPEVLNAESIGANVSFETSSFSVYGVVYTVDFGTFDGGTYSVPGEGSYKLADLLPMIIGDEGQVSAAALELIEGDDIAGALYLTRDENGNWYINSDVPFTSVYLLTMTVDGVSYEVRVTDAGEVDLTTIGSIQVTCEESETSTEVSRDAAINFKMVYTISGSNNIDTAKNATQWVYDMSSMIGSDPNSPLASLSEGDTGAIHDDFGNVVGEYQITNGKIILKITENSFWQDPSTGAQKTEVSGYVSFNAKLNENHNYNKSEEIIHFPGNANVPIKYETKTLQSSKGVGTSEGAYSHTTDASEVQMVENSDGTYSLYYEISATPNIDFKTLKISDTLAGGQSLDASSVQLSVNGGSWQNVQVTSSGSGFSLDVAANQGGTVHGGTTYKIRYKTTLSHELVTNKAVQTNRASWNWDVGTNEDNTSVKPKFDKNVTVGKTAGTVEGTYNLGNWADANVVENPDGSATIYYDVKITSNTKELSSLTVTDAMMGSGTVEVLKGTTSLGTATATSGTVDLLSFLNGKGGVEPGADYHLRYSTTIQPKDDGTFDNVNNKVRIVYDNTPKETEITVKPKIDKTITSGKTVRGNGGEQATGNLTVQKNNNEDYYRLHYKITVKPGTGSNILTVKDTISAGQEYVSGSFYLGFNDQNTWRSFEITPTVTGNSFDFDLASFLRSKGYQVTPQTTYQISYDTKITDEQIGSSVTNTSEWTWDHGKSGPDTTDVTPEIPEKGYKIDKTAMHGNVNVGNDQQHLYVVPGDVIDFTVVVGLDEDGNPKDMAGHRIYDEISNYGTLEGDVTISPPVGETTTLGGATLDGTADGSMKKVYDFTFPSEGEFIQSNGYTITYHIKISQNSELSGRKQLLNKAYIDQTHKETKTPVDYGAAATTRKSFSAWNENDKKIYWYIDVEIPEGKSLHNLYVTDYHMQYGTNSDGNGWLADAANLSFDSTDITVSWLDESITEPAPSFTLKNDVNTPNDSTVNTKGIFFEELNHSIRIRVATISPVEFDSLTAYYAYNKAYVHSDEGKIGEPGASTDRYIATDYRFKKTGTYDQASNVATWKVEINKSFLEVNPDFAPYFTDTIPENMELIGDTIHVDGYIGNNNTNHGNVNMQVTVVDNVIQPVYIGYLHPEWGSGGLFKLSKNYYIVTYQTKIKDEYLQEILDANVLTEQKFTNFAALQDENGVTKKTDDDTVEYKYDNLIKKESGQLILNEYIPYTVIINPESKVINDNKPYTTSDVISTDVNLYIGSISGTTYPYVVDDSGTDLLKSGEVSISYNDDTRELSITVPDGKKVTFAFAVNAIESGTKTFKNTVVLNAKITDEDSTEKEYTIKKSEAGITGVELYVSLKKIDRNDPLKGLPGAKFKLVHVKTPGIPRNEDGKPTTVTTYVDADGETQYVAAGDGTFGEEEVVGTYSTIAGGALNFTQIKPYEVYYWVETDPAPGYIMTNTEKHYFVAYPIVKNDTAATTENQHHVWAIDNTVTEANGVTIVSARSGYSWNVTNLKEESVSGHFEGVKTLRGRDMEKDEFMFSVEAVSANVKKIIDDAEQEVSLTPADMPMPANSTVQNPAGTKDTEVGFEFGNIDFTMPGTYKYTIKETAGTDNTISYDQTEYTAEVTINRDSESGELQNPVIQYKKADGNEVTKPVFVNTLKQGSLSITKVVHVNGDAPTTDSEKKLVNGEYIFTVSQNDKIIKFVQITVENGAPASYKIADTMDGLASATSVSGATAIVSDLAEGDYVIAEVEKNGMTLDSASRGDGNTSVVSEEKAVTVHVTAGQNEPAETSAASATFTNNIDKGYLIVHKEVTYNGVAPTTIAQKQVLEGTYTFKLYSDQNCTKPVKNGEEDITLTVTIGSDGLAQDSAKISVPAGTYWLKEIVTEDSYVLPVGENPQEVTISKNDTEVAAKKVNFKNNYELNEEDDKIAVDIVKKFVGLTSEEQIPSGFKVVLSYTDSNGANHTVDLGSSSYEQQDGVQVKFSKSDNNLTWTWHVYNIPKGSNGFSIHEEKYDKTGYKVAVYLDGTEVENPGTSQLINVTPPQAALTEITDTGRITPESTLRSFYVGNDYVIIVSVVPNKNGVVVISDKSLNFLQRQAIQKTIENWPSGGPFGPPVRFFSTEQHNATINVGNNRDITVRTDANGKQYIELPPKTDNQAAAFTVTYNQDSVYNNAVIENRYTPEGVDIDIIKIEQGNPAKHLPGATFSLRQLADKKASSNGTFENMEGTTPKTVTTDKDGKASFTGLSFGYYELKETASPIGYVMTGDVMVYFRLDEEGIKFLNKDDSEMPSKWSTITGAGTGSSLVTFTAAQAAVADNPETTDVDESKAATNATFTVENTPGTQLPQTGGIGTTLFTALGSIMTATAGAILTIKSWQRRRENA